MDISWGYGAVGGLMIGAAAAIYLLMNGRIMGASGIAGGLVDGTGVGTWKERAAFLAGLIGVPAIISLFLSMPPTNVTNNLPLLVVAGIFVGIGTRLGSGCTSGHGVCGMSRFSVRSIVATLIYIGAGIAMVALARMGGLI